MKRLGRARRFWRWLTQAWRRDLTLSAIPGLVAGDGPVRLSDRAGEWWVVWTTPNSTYFERRRLGEIISWFSRLLRTGSQTK